MFIYTFKINGFGNYSHSYNWDNGIDFSEPVYTEEEFIPNDGFMGRYVNEIFTNEHGGSRNVDLLVQAGTIEDAMTYARIYGEHYYPQKG